MSGPVTEAVDDSRLTDLERLTILRLHQRIRMNDSRLTDLDRLLYDFGPSIAVAGHRPIHCRRRPQAHPLRSAAQLVIHNMNMDQDVLDKDTIVVSCGLLNFEKGSYSLQKTSVIADRLKNKCEPGRLTTDPTFRAFFISSFKRNYPDLCKDKTGKDRNIVVIDCTQFRHDPNDSKELRSHKGTHWKTMNSIVKAPNFKEVHQPLTELRVEDNNLVIDACKVGRHRSVSIKALQIPSITNVLYGGDSSRVGQIDLQCQSDWTHLCNALCDHCFIKWGPPRCKEHAAAFEDAMKILLPCLKASIGVPDRSLLVASSTDRSSSEDTSASTGPAMPPKLRTPASIEDTRFEKKRVLRKSRCGQCGELKGGNASGAFYHRNTMPLVAEREAAWERGDWDATWYCTECYMRCHNFSYEAVIDMLGFTERAAKKARYVNV